MCVCVGGAEERNMLLAIAGTERREGRNGTMDVRSERTREVIMMIQNRYSTPAQRLHPMITLQTYGMGWSIRRRWDSDI